MRALRPPLTAASGWWECPGSVPGLCHLFYVVQLRLLTLFVQSERGVSPKPPTESLAADRIAIDSRNLSIVNVEPWLDSMTVNLDSSSTVSSSVNRQ